MVTRGDPSGLLTLGEAVGTSTVGVGGSSPSSIASIVGATGSSNPKKSKIKRVMLRGVGVASGGNISITPATAVG